MKSSCLLLHLWLLCTIMTFTLFLFEETRGQCLPHHESLLLKFKHSLLITGSSNWSENPVYSRFSEWNSRTDCCLWPGVTCSGAYVTGLDLGYEGIFGGFNNSSPLFQLTSLVKLNLATMYQETVIPSGIGRLVNLMHLNLSGSSFIGQIPMQISNLTRLVSLDFSNCYSLKVENPNLHMLLGNLSNLIELRLDGVDLSSQSRVWCQALSTSTPRLQVLSLHGCGLSGAIHDSLQNLTHLSIVDLSTNLFAVTFPHGVFSSLKNLTSVTLNSCEFSGEFPHTMLQLPTLQFLDVGNNSALEASPSPLFSFRNSSLEILRLFGTRFWKTIPESIGEAKMLSQLDLGRCNLYGQIPKSVTQLDHLVSLDLSDNNLDGNIPSFSRLRNLTTLDLRNNSLSGSILTTDWKMLPQLQMLYLHGNRLSGSIPATLFEIPSLVILYLRINHFSGFTKESNVTPSGLQYLSMSYNDLQGILPPFIYGLHSLIHLDLSYSLLQVPAGNNVSFFPQLVSLELASCTLKEFPSFLASQPGLQYLDLSDNQITGHIPDHIWNMSALEYLNISHNQLKFLNRNDDFASGLQILDLSSNKLHGSIPKSVCNHTNLALLDLSKNFFSSSLPSQCWSQLPSLIILDLSKNNISGTIPDTFESLSILETMDLSQNSFQGGIPKSLGRCLNLKVLDLGYNKLHGKFPCWLNGLDQLRVLVLRSNLLYGSIQCLNQQFNWTRLQIMDIASNEFDGNLPPKGLLKWKSMMVDKYPAYQMDDDQNYLGVYINYANIMETVSVIVKGYQRSWTKISTSFTLVDFSDNKFEGDIPHELGELKFLYALNLSHNYLSGKIPTSFGNLFRIESLDLSENDLSGKIPGQLAALNFLSAFNVSFNHLEGMIPKGSQFQTFTEASFMGNEGLCGQPLNTSCGNESVNIPPKQSSEGEDNFRRNIFIATQIGYTLGFGLIIVPLFFWSSWRKRYYECIDKILNTIFCRQSKKKAPVPRKTRRRN